MANKTKNSVFDEVEPKATPDDGQADTSSVKSDNPRERMHQVVVHHSDMHPDNKFVKISVNDMGASRAKGFKEFYPGQKVWLSEVQIHILEELSSIDDRLPIADDSAIYQAQDPLGEARMRNPGYGAEMDANGRIYLTRHQPRFIVQRVG